MDDNAEIISEFLVESHDNLDQLDREFVALEGDPQNRERLASIFRTIHTIKGTSGFLAFGKLESVAHVGETLLSRLREGELLLDADITTGLLSMVDAIRGILGNIEQSGNEGDGDYTQLIELLKFLTTREQVPESNEASVMHASLPAVPEPQAGGDSGDLAPAVEMLLSEHPPQASEPEEISPAAAIEAYHAAASLRPPQAPEPVVPSVGEILVDKGITTHEEVAAAQEQQAQGDPRRLGEILVARGSVPPAAVLDALQTQNEAKTASVADQSIRVDVGLLDKLMNLVGELVLARNQVLQHTSRSRDAALAATTQRLNLITSELQEGIMKTRMQPIGNVWSKFPRVVRDLSLACGKQVRLEMEGKETELDRTIIEAIKDPLTHLVRNSVDHGIEKPEARATRGKNPQGTLLIRAFHEGGKVNIEIIDDGAGIDPEKIRRKAVERGLVSADRASRMSDREVQNMIFLPGFSTAEKVTNVSGRGVGMDVVKTNIEKIGGSVDIQSRVGEGTCLRIKIPLTLAIIPALMVTCGGDRYAIPQVNLLELVRLDAEQAKSAVEFIHGTPVYRLRGRLLPLVFLRKVLRVTEPPAPDDTVSIIVLQADDQQFGLIVDGVSDTEEIVVKPLGAELKSITAYAGATIMGDGRVALILDVLGLAQEASMATASRDKALAEAAIAEKPSQEQPQPILVFQVREEGRMAIPLNLVARLEEFPYSMVELSGNEEVVQYRDEILPLIRLSRVLGLPERPNASNLMQVIVYSEGCRSVGIVVDHVLDIVDETLVVRRRARQPGLLGTAVIQGRVTDLLDVQQVIRTADPSFFEGGAE